MIGARAGVPWAECAAVAEEEAILDNNSVIVFLCLLPCLHRWVPIMTATATAIPSKKKIIELCAWIPTLLFQLINPMLFWLWESMSV